LSVQKEQADQFTVLYFPHFLLFGCNSAVTSSAASVFSGRQYLFTSVSPRFAMFHYERIQLLGGGWCRFTSFWLEIPHPADSLLGDIRCRQASLCFPILSDSDRDNIV
jgi:hypothetical protein